MCLYCNVCACAEITTDEIELPFFLETYDNSQVNQLSTLFSLYPSLSDSSSRKALTDEVLP